MSYRPTAQEIINKNKRIERLKAALARRPAWRFNDARIAQLEEQKRRLDISIAEKLSFNVPHYAGLIWVQRAQVERLDYEITFIKADLSK